MASGRYLAMTGAEFSAAGSLPGQLCWMACHFSPYGTGLTNLPPALPPGSLIIINDRIPFCGHDILRISDQLEQLLPLQECGGILLDFAQQEIRELQQLAEALTASLPCPVAVSESYARGLHCPVFLSPCPHHTHLPEHLAPWAGRELWLDLAADGETIHLTRDGASFYPLPLGEIPPEGHWDDGLHCHYSIQSTDESALFTLWRTREDLDALSEEASSLGIKTQISLWQEWHHLPKTDA